MLAAMDMMEKTALLELAAAAMEEVGAFQLSEWRKRSPGWGDEKAAKELVSFVDIESERRLAESLVSACPGAGFYGEEGGKRLGDNRLWVVDPLDGTTNYLSGLDWFCISVALFEEGRPILGLVYRPALAEWWWALRDGGAYHLRGGRPRSGTALSASLALPRALPCPLDSSLVCTGTPFRSPDTREAFFAAAGDLLVAARDLRRLGSAALDLCSLASGWLQAFWEVDLEPYDVGAAVLVLEEAGCPVTSFSGAGYEAMRHRSLVTGMPGAAEELRAIVARRYGSLRE
jgi:myo-inositol-1(or 4)-monophosphatase